MIKVSDEIIKKQKNFWNACLFHPTDAIEDPWGKRILDRIASDKSINTIRIYTMFEDIVYFDEYGKLQYDFRVSDLRLDYLIEKGYNLLLSYGGIPDCIASETYSSISMANNKTRYKGKMWNSNPPKDYALWEEICYEYTKHNIERYGIETVSKWRCQCFNEPDVDFFMAGCPTNSDTAVSCRLPEYCKLYESFQKGVYRASKEISVGGPALAVFLNFLGGFLDYVKKKNLKLDFITLHNYGTEPTCLLEKKEKISVSNNINKHLAHLETIKAHGFENTPIIIDEWGMATCGFFNSEKYPDLMCRETEVFSAYFAKLIYKFIHSEQKIEELMICLSGQHEMTQDFTGFRNFFTLHFIAKPIYNAYILASKLHNNILNVENNNKNIFVIPTKDNAGHYAVLLSYSSEYFEENLPTISETIHFDGKDKGNLTVWMIDKETSNPYRLYEKNKMAIPTKQEICLLQEEGRLKPIKISEVVNENITIQLSPNATCLITYNTK